MSAIIYRRDAIGWYAATVPACPPPPKGRHWYECPVCKTTRPVRASDAKRSIKNESENGRNWRCQNCHNARVAHLGAEATLKRHGIETLVWHIQNRQCQNPSKPEQAFIEALTANGFTPLMGCDYAHDSQPYPMSTQYVREYWFTCWQTGKNYLVDFWFQFGNHTIAVEINGTYVHQFHTARDAAKAKALQNAGVDLLVFSDADVANGIAEKQFLKEWNALRQRIYN